MNHYPHHIGDFNNATRHLTRVERSLYRDMIELYYDTEQPLNVDPAKIARRVLATSDDEREALKLVLEEFFVLQDDGWHNTRCDEEIAKYQGQIEQASRAGKASAAKRYGKNLTPVERPFNQPEPEPEPEPEPIVAAVPLARPTAKASRLPAGWVPNSELQAWAAAERPDLYWKTTVDSFVDFWKSKPGKEGTKLDWDATFRNWVRSQRQQFKVVNSGTSMFAGGK